jgi:hypothetical protein
VKEDSAPDGALFRSQHVDAERYWTVVAIW